MTEALIVGAGPVGLAMAAELTRYGVAVRIVEKAAQRTDKSKALVLWSRTLELLNRAGVAQPFVDAGMQVNAVQIVAESKQIARVTLDSVDSPYPFGLMLPQSDTERLLEQHLRSLGIQVERSVELTTFTPAADTVHATLKHPDGREESLTIPWFIGCDGAHSAVRHGLGVQFQGDTLLSDWILGDLHLAGVPAPTEVTVHWHTDGALIIFPIRGDRFRVIADVTLKDTATEPSLADIQAVLDQRASTGIKASQPIWLASFHINERKVKDYRVGRVFLAGDAAHVHSPAGGQGMNTGIQDACNLAWKLALVCRGGGNPETLLGSYSPERSAVGEQVLKAAGRVTSIGIMRGEIKQSIRNHIASAVLGFPHVQHLAAEAATELSIGYPDSPLNGLNHPVQGGPRAGQRAPIRPGETPVGAGSSPRFALFSETAPDALLSRYSALLEPKSRPPFHSGGLWLVRPDGYVAVAAKAEDWHAVEEFLNRLASNTPVPG